MAGIMRAPSPDELDILDSVRNLRIKFNMTGKAPTASLINNGEFLLHVYKDSNTSGEFTQYIKVNDELYLLQDPTKLPLSHEQETASVLKYSHAKPTSILPVAPGEASSGVMLDEYARGDHRHPLQTEVSGNAGSATKLQTSRSLTIGSTSKNFDGSANISWTLTEIGAMPSSARGIANGVAPLGTDVKIPASYLPSYVDDVLEYSSKTALDANADGLARESGKIYVTLDDNKTWRWSGTTHVEISPSLALGYTASTAAPGNHTHLYAGSSSAGGVATSAKKWDDNLSITLGTDAVGNITFSGPGSKILDITVNKITDTLINALFI